jgi:hypothetical protein
VGVMNHDTVTCFAPLITEQLRARRKGKASRSWQVDETYASKPVTCSAVSSTTTTGNIPRLHNAAVGVDTISAHYGVATP